MKSHDHSVPSYCPVWPYLHNPSGGFVHLQQDALLLNGPEVAINDCALDINVVLLALQVEALETAPDWG